MKGFVVCWLRACCMSMLSVVSVLAQQMGSRPCDSFVHRIATFTALYHQEKVYLHFDNTCYYLGDTLWYKANAVDAEGWKPTKQSRILYVDLLTQEGYLVKRNRHYIERGQCDGCFALPDSLQAVYYEVRAYTAWMLNFGRVVNSYLMDEADDPRTLGFYLPGQAEKFLCENPCVFSRVFPVYNGVKDGNYRIRQMRTRPRINYAKQPAPKVQALLTLFPEGGHLIAGQLSRIAYELRNEEGKPLHDVALRLRLTSGEVLTTLYPQHNGRGCFEVTPRMWREGLNKCRLTCIYRGKEYEFRLPRADESGVSLRLDVALDTIKACIVPIGIEDSLAFTVQHNGRLVAYRAIPSDRVTNFSLACDTLSGGVHQLTVFDAQGRIRADRLFFVYPRGESACLEASLPDTLAPYAEGVCTLMLHDGQGDPIPDETFSVSVRDGDMDDNRYAFGHVGTYLLLSSELKGFIASPEYYFAPDNIHRVRDLDVLMMVQGWRRYDWEIMAGVKPFHMYYHPEEKLQVSGCVYRRNAPKKWKNEVFVRCQIHYPGYIYEGVQQTKDGRFVFDVLPLYGNYPMFLQAYKKEKQIKETFDYTELDNEVYGYGVKYHYIWKNRALPPLPKQFDYYELHEKDLSLGYDSLWQEMIDEVTVKKVRNSLVDFTQPNCTYDVAELCDFLNDVGYIREDIINHRDFMHYIVDFCVFDRSTADLRAIKEGNLEEFDKWGQLLVFTINGETKFESPAHRNYCLDFRFSNLNTISYHSDCTDRKRFLGPLKGYPSTTQIYFNYNLYHNKRVPTMLGDKCVLYGYTPKVQYYSVDYSGSLPPEPDYRRTLYWNPNVRTDSTGRAYIHFYNNATCNKPILSAEGITQDGKLFYLHKSAAE